ncbi:glycosyltransferase [Desulfovibrio mangrovi]|uniref:glycosyltransferase n=1 Tax=Desulfovibrio mangrovi TaxID=2976983 RepID=UPI00224596E0|nr:glycosyltransferase [Desulfovibrio mangrovi]UZP68076.1 glycosyltransferase [Desulfovibrio mangrovi]
MRTLQIINVRWFNATAWYGLYLGTLLQRAGHETRIIVLQNTPGATKTREWGMQGIHMDLNTAQPVRLLRTYGQMHRLVTGFKPDIVNCHRGEGFMLWGLLKKQLAGGPNAFKLVRTRGDQRLPKNNAINRWLHTDVADAVVATNSVMARHFTDVLHVPASKVHTIFGGVDAERFTFEADGRARVRAEFGYREDDFVVGLLGRFDEVKGQRETIEAVASLRRQGMTNIRLMLLGFDSATPQKVVQDWIRENGVEDISVITGKRDDVVACLSALDAGVIASKWSETIARAALEIMACERPLISTDVGVMPDLLEPDALFRPADVEALAAAIRRVATDADYRRTLLEQQQLRIRSLSGQHFLDQTLSLYNALLQK